MQIHDDDPVNYPDEFEVSAAIPPGGDIQDMNGRYMPFMVEPDGR